MNSNEKMPLLIKKRRFPKIFFGWWTVLASGIIHMWVAGYHTYGFSALFKPIASELGFTRTVTSVPASIARLEGGLEAPITGWLTDRFGPRWIIFTGVFLVGLGFVLMNYINSLWSFYIVWGVIAGTGHNIATSVAMDTAIANWFVKKRGLAVSIKFVFSGLSGVLVLPLVAWLINIQGWRAACVTGGFVMWLVGLPLAWFCLRQHRPEYYGLLPDGATAEEAVETNQMIGKGVEYAAEVEEVEFTARQAVKTMPFWLLIVAQASHSLAGPAINIHCIPFLTDMGIEPIKAAGMMAMILISSMPTRFFGGFIADRLKKRHLRFLMAAASLLQAAGFAFFLLNQSTAMIYVWFILYGVGMGAGMSIHSLIRARYFGRKAFGSVYGFSSMMMTPVGIAAPIYLGWVYDTTGSYMTAFTLLTVLLAISGVITLFILPPKPPAEVSDIRKIV